MDESKDHLERRCPRLGGPVMFRYCRLNSDNELPCWKVLDCWWEVFDVVEYMKANLHADAYNMLRSLKPKPKITSIVEMIERAKKRIDE